MASGEKFINLAMIKERQSNIEALRIVAMIFIVLLHANYFSLGSISQADILSSPFPSFVRMFCEQICIVGVNIFVLISGWFGIRPTFKGAVSILYQVFFFSLLILLVGIIVGIPIPGLKIIKLFYFGGHYWFIPAYLCLYTISPILNSYIDSSNRNEALLIILAYFCLEFMYGWLADMAAFNAGYSAMSFIGLYLIARYINKYPTRLKSIKPVFSFGLYLAFSIIPTIIALFGLKYIGHAFSPIKYCSPFVVLASLFLFLTFQGLQIKSKFINWIAASVFAVYIIHLNPMIENYFKGIMNTAFQTLSGALYCLFSIGVAISLCLVCAIPDQLRLVSWRYICSFSSKKVYPIIERIYKNGIQKII